jgi:hypothetical protein
MDSNEIKDIHDKLEDVIQRLVRVETLLDTDQTIDVSRLRWDAKAINYVIMKVVSPVLITVLLGGSLFYYGIRCQITDLTTEVATQIEKHSSLSTQETHNKRILRPQVK